MKKSLLQSSLLLLALGTAGASFAQTPDQTPQAPPTAPSAIPEKQPNPNHQAKELSKKLGLSPDQAAQLEPILADRDQKIEALNANTSLDPKSMRQQRRAINVDADQKVNAILTPAQQQQYANLKAKRKQHAQAVQGASTIM